MVASRGVADVRRFMRQLPAELEKKVLRGAARAGGKIILEEAKDRSISHDVDEALVLRSKAETGRITVKITVRKGWGRAIANWLEYGTDPHFISVDDSVRQGMSSRRINERIKDGDDALHSSLFINGKAVGTTVFHTGAQANPFLRPALDIKGADAIAAAQAYINARVTPLGIIGSAEPEGDDA